MSSQCSRCSLSHRTKNCKIKNADDWEKRCLRENRCIRCGKDDHSIYINVRRCRRKIANKFVIQYYDQQDLCYSCGRDDHHQIDCGYKTQCFLCKNPRHDHEARKCNKFCLNCYEFGHSYYNCNQSNDDSSDDSGDGPQCLRCGERDHKFVDCENSPFCYFCEMTNHGAIDCPYGCYICEDHYADHKPQSCLKRHHCALCGERNHVGRVCGIRREIRK